MIRKLVLAIILVPLAVAFITFSVANRQIVVVSLDPFDQSHPAIAISLPLFALILVFIIGGVVVGGVAILATSVLPPRIPALAPATTA